MDNEFSPTHFLSTPTTISSVSPFIQKSYDLSLSRPSFSSERMTYSPVPERTSFLILLIFIVDKENGSFASTPQPPVGYDDLSYSPIPSEYSISKYYSDDNMKESSSPYESTKGHVVEMAKDISQGRQLQRILNQLSFSELDEVYKEIRSNLVELMIDPVGNYLFQKLLESSSDERLVDMVDWFFSWMTS